MFLECSGIKKSFGSGDSLVHVLKGIDLTLEKGEFCVLLGPSGSGSRPCSIFSAGSTGRMKVPSGSTTTRWIRWMKSI